MNLNPYLTFQGRCKEAFLFYERCLGGKIETMVTHGESPICDQTPPEWRDKILHTALRVGDQLLMGSDPPLDLYEETKGIAVTITVDDPQEAECIFHALAENGAIRMPIQKTFWAERFGMLVDQFGIPWMINGGMTA